MNPYSTPPVDFGAGGRSAQATFAELTRAQWQNYVTQFRPFEDRLIDYATDPQRPIAAMAEASQDVATAFDNRAASQQRRLRSLGLTLDADEQRAADRSLGLARALADVNAQTVARDQTLARQRGLLGNPAPTFGSM